MLQAVEFLLIKYKACSSYMVNTVVADGLATQGSRH